MRLIGSGLLIPATFMSVCCFIVTTTSLSQEGLFGKGYDIEKTGLVPKYPDDMNCSPLTSLYASWIDLDGSTRDEPHSGVDGGRIGESIFAPASGVVRAAWKANWRWGNEGALLLRHSKADLNLNSGADYYYSEFDHLRLSDASLLSDGESVRRGQRLASVFRPGGHDRYLPEVHWEVWEVGDDSLTAWHLNKFRGRYWTNVTARLIDPLYMLSRQTLPHSDGSVDIHPYLPQRDGANYAGFSYILPCVPNHPSDIQ